MNKSSKANLEILFLLFIAVFFILAPHPGINVANNASIYLSEGAYLSQGNGPTILKNGLVARGPVFSYIIAIAFLPAGASVTAAFLLMKVLFSLLLVFLYKAACDLYDRKTAVVSIIFAAVSFRVYLIGTSIDTNSLLAIFLLLFILCIHRTWANPRNSNYFFSGLILVMAYLIKETSLVFAPLLIASFMFPKCSWSEVSKRILYSATAIILCLLPWAIYVHKQTGSLLPILGHFNPEFRQAFSNKVGNDVTQGFFNNFLNYLYGFFTEMLPAATWLYLPLIILLIWQVAYFVYKRGRNPQFKADTVLLAAIGLYLPIPISDMAVGSGDPRQGFIIYLLLFILSGRWISTLISKWMPNLDPAKIGFLAKRLMPAATILLVVSIIFLYKGHINHPDLAKVQKALHQYNPVPPVKGRYTDLQRQAALWMEQNIPADVPLIVDGYLEEPLNFFTSNKYKMTVSFQPQTSNEYDIRKKPLFILTYKKFQDSNGSRRFFWMLDESSILDKLEPGTIVAFTHLAGFLRDYFNAAPWAAYLYGNDHIQLYRVEQQPFSLSQGSNHFPLHINREFREDMEWARVNDPDTFTSLTSLLHSMRLNYPSFLDTARILNPGEYL